TRCEQYPGKLLETTTAAHRNRGGINMWKSVLTSTAFTILAPHAAYAAWTPPATGFVYAVIAVVLVMTIVALAAVAQKLAATATWSLADALSEETDLTVSDANNLPYTVDGVVVKKTELRASSSRLIAFLGMIAILVMFIGFGVF